MITFFWKRKRKVSNNWQLIQVSTLLPSSVHLFQLKVKMARNCFFMPTLEGQSEPASLLLWLLWFLWLLLLWLLLLLLLLLLPLLLPSSLQSLRFLLHFFNTNQAKRKREYTLAHLNSLTQPNSLAYISQRLTFAIIWMLLFFFCSSNLMLIESMN